MKNKILPILASVILIAALGIAMYPTVSQWVNDLLSESAIMQYNDTVDTLSVENKAAQFAEAEEYNRGLNEVVSDSFSSEAFAGDERYNSILNITEDGQIGTINIPSIDCRLPIYHGSSEDMLTKGAVHLAGTAFPIGGSSARSVISAHTAFPGKIFFDRLSEVEIGESFSVTVLRDTLYYKVTEINIVLPDEVEYLQPVKDKDLITLVTCTPYALNTHRLLVTGERDHTPRAELSVPEISQNKPTDLGLIVVLTTLVIIIGSILIKRAIRKKREMKHEK
ncbi:class C sortase [Ruminococcus sp.]|uniref:class C sortase n=1 Tax=Ruminococcus sp. TaxID=41978 RepID=UPI0038903DC3